MEYTGDIYRIYKINNRLLDFLKKYDIVDEDMRAACYYELIKTNAKLIKVGNYYIDIDSIEDTSLDYICELANSNSDNNILIKTEVNNPYVGELFVKNLKKENNIIKKLKY